MISDPVKFQFEDVKKNFSFRPISPKFKQNIKLKPFVPDKIRIEKFLKTKQLEDDFINKKLKKSNKKDIHFNKNDHNTPNVQEVEGEDRENNIYFNKNNEKNNINSENYLQPIMKFKPRTDLERIFDTINLNYFGKISKNLINEQLKSLGLVKVYNKKNNTKNTNEYSLLREKLKVNPETLDYLIKEKQILQQGPKSKEIHELINNMENIININKEIQSEQNNKTLNFNHKGKEKANKYKNKRKNLNNFLAKSILGEYQKKTHFKALCTYSLDLNTKNNFHKREFKHNSLSFDNMLNLSEKNNKNNDINNIYKKKFKNQKRYTPMKLAYLKNLFMKKDNISTMQLLTKDKDNNDKKVIEDQNESNNKIIRQQNNFFINGIYYNKDDIKGISDAVLKKCNYITKHFEPQNIGEGKLMFTRGMTVNEFTQKYGLPK